MHLVYAGGHLHYHYDVQYLVNKYQCVTRTKSSLRVLVQLVLFQTESRSGPIEDRGFVEVSHDDLLVVWQLEAQVLILGFFSLKVQVSLSAEAKTQTVS